MFKVIRLKSDSAINIISFLSFSFLLSFWAFQ